jgi:hypothetical protein
MVLRLCGLAAGVPGWGDALAPWASVLPQLLGWGRGRPLCHRHRSRHRACQLVLVEACFIEVRRKANAANRGPLRRSTEVVTGTGRSNQHAPAGGRQARGGRRTPAHPPQVMRRPTMLSGPCVVGVTWPGEPDSLSARWVPLLLLLARGATTARPCQSRGRGSEVLAGTERRIGQELRDEPTAPDSRP